MEKSVMPWERLISWRAPKQVAALRQVSRRVVHDIRSPLMALAIATEDLSPLDETRKELVRQAVRRILEIANDFLFLTHEAPLRTESLLGPLIDIYREKTALLPGTRPVEIILRVSPLGHAAQANVQAAEFKRVLSNLVDNAIESMPRGGRLVLALDTSDDKATILIEDEGKGIAPEILPKLMRLGATFGKKGGTGLGLFHAKQSIKKWGGKISIESRLNEGTCVKVSLPLVKDEDRV